MILDLKHGKLQCKLHVCNDTLLSAISKFEDETETSFMSVFSGSGLGFAAAMSYYAYFSYKSYCSRNNKLKEYSLNEFKDLWNAKDVEEGDSNIAKVIEELSQTFISNANSNTKKKEASLSN